MPTYELDASNQSLGRLAAKIATLLRGKNTPAYIPDRIADVEVLVSNIDKIRFTGNKLNTRQYHKYSGYPGGLKTRTLGQLWNKNPKEVVRKSVYRMLPPNRSRDKIITHLKFK